MSIIDKIKALWTLRSVGTEIIQEATKMDSASSKPGWKTTEFWSHVATQLAVLWGAVQGFVPPKVAAIVSVAGTAVYVVARTIAKAVSDIQAAKSAPASSQDVTTIPAK